MKPRMTSTLSPFPPLLIPLMVKIFRVAWCIKHIKFTISVVNIKCIRFVLICCRQLRKRANTFEGEFEHFTLL